MLFDGDFSQGLCPSHSHSHSFCRSGEKYNSECISTTVKHGGRGDIVCGAFSAACTGQLLHCEKQKNALEYRRILKKGFQKLFSKVEQSDVIFQQDNAPAKTTKMWLGSCFVQI